MRFTTRSTPRSARSQRRVRRRRAALRPDIFNLDFSKEFAVGFAKPLSVASAPNIARSISRSARATPVLRDRPVVPRFDHDHRGELHDPAGRVQRGHRRLQLPGRAGAGRRAGLPRHPGVSATDESRHSWAAYVELDTDPIEGVTTTLAGRYEHFSDFGSTWNGKFAARWEPVDGYALRGSISNGFRAPSLHQQFFTTTSTNFIAGLPVDISTLAVNSPVALALGSQPLKPEKSVNLSFGRDRQSAPRPDAHRRPLPDQDQGPHRPHRESRRGRQRHRGPERRGQGGARRQRLPERRRGPLLHQRPRHDHPRNRRRRRLPHAHGGLRQLDADRGL
jgi:hypothetical protein